jgi:hypothetical protein
MTRNGMRCVLGVVMLLGLTSLGFTPDSRTSQECQKDDPTRLCLAIKYVVYKDSHDRVLISEEQARKNVASLNAFYERCGIGFDLAEFLSVRPEDHGLRFRLSSYPELDRSREAFADPRKLLIVTTGPWDRTGPIGNTGANAWTRLPGGGPHGAILESPVGKFPNIIAHEIGHYLNLMHVDEPTSLMNKIIYAKSAQISDEQCQTARQTVTSHWRLALRKTPVSLAARAEPSMVSEGHAD